MNNEVKEDSDMADNDSQASDVRLPRTVEDDKSREQDHEGSTYPEGSATESGDQGGGNPAGGTVTGGIGGGGAEGGR